MIDNKLKWDLFCYGESWILFAVIASHSITHRKLFLAPLDVRFHFSNKRDSRFLDNNSIMFEEPFMRIIGILTYRVVKNRYDLSDKGLQMDTQEWRDGISGRDQTRLSVLGASWHVKSDRHVATGLSFVYTFHFPHISFSKYNCRPERGD